LISLCLDARKWITKSKISELNTKQVSSEKPTISTVFDFLIL
jgi:hypothetical protein